MKKYTILALVLVLCAALFAGCRNRNDVNNTMGPESSATTTPTAATTSPTTQPTTEATQQTTMPATESIPDSTGDGPMEGTDSTDGTGGMEGRMRPVNPGSK